MDFSTTELLAMFGIVGSSIGYTLGLVTYNFINSFIVNIISPLLNLVIKKDLKDWTIILFNGVQLGIGKLIMSFLDAVIVLGLILLLIHYFLPDVVRHKRKSNDRVANLLEKIVAWRVPL